jgi:aldose 1-epimerase
MAFETTINQTGKHAVITLKDLSNNTFAEVYSFGALLNKFCAGQHEELLNIIDGFSTPDEATEKITPFFKSAKLSPYACRIKDAKYAFGEKNYQLQKYSSHNHALHGLIFDAGFSITNHYGNETAASVTLDYEYNNTNTGYPFCYKCSVEYKLSAGNTLTIITTVTNADEKLMPLADGWHPYFTLGDSINDYQLEFQSKEMLEFDEDLIPTGKLLPFQEFGSLKDIRTMFLDNCFTLNFAECQPMCVLRNPARKVQVEFRPSASYPYLQIYTPEHRKSIAIENLSAPPDAFNNGIDLKVLEPNEVATFSTSFLIKFL